MGLTRTSVLGLAVLAILSEGPCDLPVNRDESGTPANVPSVSQNEPGPGDPPVVWIAGTLETIEEGHLAIQEGTGGNGPRIRLERLAGGATSFFRFAGDAWQELPQDEVSLIEVGERACVEALLDGQTFLALRVFLGSTCSPGPVG
jgi:hypothetical protein